jgi:hypothetical protein
MSFRYRTVSLSGREYFNPSTKKGKQKGKSGNTADGKSAASSAAARSACKVNENVQDELRRHMTDLLDTVQDEPFRRATSEDKASLLQERLCKKATLADNTTHCLFQHDYAVSMERMMSGHRPHVRERRLHHMQARAQALCREIDTVCSRNDLGDPYVVCGAVTSDINKGSHHQQLQHKIILDALAGWFGVIEIDEASSLIRVCVCVCVCVCVFHSMCFSVSLWFCACIPVLSCGVINRSPCLALLLVLVWHDQFRTSQSCPSCGGQAKDAATPRTKTCSACKSHRGKKADGQPSLHALKYNRDIGASM